MEDLAVLEIEKKYSQTLFYFLVGQRNFGLPFIFLNCHRFKHLSIKEISIFLIFSINIITLFTAKKMNRGSTRSKTKHSKKN